MRIKKNDVIWSFFSYGINVVANMVTLFFAVAILPTEDLGMWYTFLSLGAIVQLIDFGFLPCITRNVSFAWSGAEELTPDGVPVKKRENAINYLLLCVIIKASKYIYSIMSIIVLVAGGGLGAIYISSLVEPSQYLKYVLAWLLYIVSITLNIYYGYWAGCLQGIGAIKENNQAKVISFLCMIAITILGLKLSLGLSAMALGNLVMGIVYRLFAKKMFLNHPQVKGHNVINHHAVDKQQIFHTIKVIWPNTWKMGITSFATYLITQGNTLLCSAFLGLAETATYGLSLQICSAIITIAKILMTVYQPKFVELNLLGDKEKIRRLLSMVILVYWMIVLICGIGMILVGLPIITSIKKDTELPLLIVCFMLFYLALEGNHSCFSVYLTTKNQIPFFKASIFSACGVFILSYILVGYTSLGIWGLMLGQSITQLLYNNWKWPVVVFKELSFSPLRMLIIGVSELFGTIKKGFVKRRKQ